LLLNSQVLAVLPARFWKNYRLAIRVTVVMKSICAEMSTQGHRCYCQVWVAVSVVCNCTCNFNRIRDRYI